MKIKPSYVIGVCIAAIVGLVIMAITAVFAVQSYQNSAINKEELVESSVSDLNSEYNRRSGLLVNLAEAVLSYNKHESEVLIELSKARTVQEAGDVNASAYIKAVAERYPELKSEKNYGRYMNELAMTENRIAEHRKYCNNNVKDYHRYVRGFPARVVLSFLGYEVKTYEFLKFENAPVDAPRGLLKESKE